LIPKELLDIAQDAQFDSKGLTCKAIDLKDLGAKRQGQ
jgi:hypothetical protein